MKRSTVVRSIALLGAFTCPTLAAAQADRYDALANSAMVASRIACQLRAPYKWTQFGHRVEHRCCKSLISFRRGG